MRAILSILLLLYSVTSSAWTMLSPGVVGGPTSIIYATWNPIDKDPSITLSGGNLTQTNTISTSMVRATSGIAGKKVYWEETIGPNPINVISGVSNLTQATNNYAGQTVNSWGFYSTGQKYNNGPSAYGGAFVAGNVIGTALDMVNGCIYWSINNVWQGGGVPTSGALCTGAAFTGLTGTLYPATGGAGAGSYTGTTNFGATAFTYAPPAGYQAGVF